MKMHSLLQSIFCAIQVSLGLGYFIAWEPAMMFGLAVMCAMFGICGAIDRRGRL